MEKVIAKFNSVGATTFYVDGKRVSRERAATVYQDAAAKKFFDCTETFDCSCGGKCVVEARGYHAVQFDNDESRVEWLGFTFFSGADTVLNALKIAAIATSIPDVRRARIYLACGDCFKHEPECILVGTGGVRVGDTNCRLYRELLDELAAQDFQPALSCKTLEAKCKALTAERLEIERRERSARKEAWEAREALDATVESHLSNFIGLEV